MTGSGATPVRRRTSLRAAESGCRGAHCNDQQAGKRTGCPQSETRGRGNLSSAPGQVCGRGAGLRARARGQVEPEGLSSQLRGSSACSPGAGNPDRIGGELGEAAVAEMACLHPLSNRQAPFRPHAEQGADAALAGAVDERCGALFSRTLSRTTALSRGAELVLDGRGLGHIDQHRLHVLNQLAGEHAGCAEFAASSGEGRPAAVSAASSSTCTVFCAARLSKRGPSASRSAARRSQRPAHQWALVR